MERMFDTCDEAADALADLVAARRCRVDVPELLAMWSVAWTRGSEGTPVVLAPIHARGDALAGEGRWGDAAAAFLGRAKPAMAPAEPEPEPPAQGGVQGGVMGGVIEGPRVFHHSELEVKKRVEPPYPEEARRLNLGDQRCLVKVFVGADGVPFDAVVESCPRVFHDPVRAAVMKWRWHPPTDGRVRVDAQVTIAITLTRNG
jgi:hypothetical protein